MGVFTAAPILAYVIAAVSWHAAFGLLGVAGVVWVVAWMRYGEEGPLVAMPPRAGVAAADHVPYARLFLSRSFIGILATEMSVYWGLALLVAWMPAFLQQGLGYSVVASTVLVTLTWGMTAVLLPLTGWLSQRAKGAGRSSRAARAVPAALLVTASGLFSVIALLLAPGAAQHALLITRLFISAAWIFTLGPAMLAEIAPPSQLARCWVSPARS